METVSNIASAASKAIWGEPKTEEPVSGKQGAGTVNEPFDKGNDESVTSSNSTPITTTTNTTSPPLSNTANNTASALESKAGSDTNTKTGSKTDVHPENTPAETKASTEVPKSKDDFSSKLPHTDEEREKLMEKGEFPRDPNDHSGEPLHMHGGPSDGTKDEEELKPTKTERSKSVSQEGGNPHGKTLGTGEEYVKSSGLKADGGDFDATKPGAGAEATRLQEEKGIHKANNTVNDKDADVSSTASPGSDKTKHSKMQKIKEKLHIKK